jgi:hypothetical protein
MRLLTVFSIYCYIIAYTLSLTEGVYFPQKKGVIYLNDYTFEEALSEYQYLFISVYSEICGICINQINPALIDLYKEIQNNEISLKDVIGIAKIDGHYNKYFMNKYNIIGYPSMLLFKNGYLQSDLFHGKNVDDMIIFLRKNILKPIQYVDNKTQYNRLMKSYNKESFITYFGKNEEEINYVKEISYKYDHITFINIKDNNLIHELNATEGQLSINKFFDEPRIIESPEKNKIWKYDDLNKFILKYNHRILIEFSTKEGEKLLTQRKNILLLINKQELTKEQIKRVEYMNKININEEMLNKENKINNKNFLEIAKNVRDLIQSSYIIYRKNLIYFNNENDKNKKGRKRSLFDEEDPFGFEVKRKEVKECQKRQIQFVNKLNLNNETNCEIRLLDFENEKNPFFYKLKCGKEFIHENIRFVRNWFYKNISDQYIRYDINLNK